MKILIIVAHPDDEILGMGGTILNHTKKGDDVTIVYLTTGIASRRSSNYNNSPSYKLSKNESIKIGAANLNDILKLGLTEETYIKTKGYKTSKKFFKKGKHALDPENIKRIENDVSFNWSQKVFDFEEQQC